VVELTARNGVNSVKTTKRIIVAVLVAVFVVGSFQATFADAPPPPPPPVPVYIDEEPTEIDEDLYCEYVAAAIYAGLVPENLQYDFSQPITRAEFAALAVALYKSATGLEIAEYAEFYDTTDINVQKMGGLGVVAGVGRSNFYPYRTITRQEVAVLLARLAYVTGQPLPIAAPDFADYAYIAPWAFYAVGQMQAASIMDGGYDNYFAPDSEYTRQQSIVAMLRLYEFLQYSPVVLVETIIYMLPPPPEDENARNIRRPMVALTFDDGPSAHTGRILDVLEYHDARATFFVVGRGLRARPEVALRAHQLGNEVANHLYHHQIMTVMNNADIIRDLRAGSAAIAAITGESPPIMRPPGGAVNDRVAQTVGAEGYALIMWSIDTNDWRHRNANTVYQHIMSNVRDGDIILLHDTHQTTAAAMERVIPRLIEEGFMLVTVSELLYYVHGGIEPGRIYFHGR